MADPASVIETRRHQMFKPGTGEAVRGWCYIEDVMFDLGPNVTPQAGPIPRYY